MLKDIGKRLGLQVRVVEPVYYKDEIVSSTLVRQLLSEGNIRDANRLLGRPFGIVGEVINGKGLGKRLGVPTANIKPAGKYVVPKKGVYRTITRVNERYYPSATNVGINPTFSEQELKVETYILDFDQSIYGLEIEVYFMEYIRPEIKFENTDKLKRKMDEDIAYVRSKSNLQLI
jgi:riboflavin kinase/FMN adenylyltransferase